MEIPAKFVAATIEKKWSDYWEDQQYFKSQPDNRQPYTIVIPPPNVTGVLHMGHMLNNTLQDVLIRRARMMGFNACWVPGTDHASIATEAKVVAKLKGQGIDKKDLSRDEFLKHAWDWTKEYGGVILKQLRYLGCSCDWNRTRFTLDPEMYESVLQVFVDLYEKGLIYKGFRMVNWDPEAQTTVSDEEVIYEEKDGHLYHIHYPIVGSENHLTIATTRPETLLGDTAICIHPEDERYIHLHGKKAIVPLANREIPIITDPYVDREFGTGCLKVTPAHDPNDKELGEKHNLAFIDIFNPDGTLNAHGLSFEGMDRFEARKAIAKALDEEGILAKKEQHRHKVGTSERTKAVVEPRISEQWFLRMEELAQPALKAVMETGEVALIPEKFKNTYRHWMENIRDWNISRQLWWGHRIPVYYYGIEPDEYVVAISAEAALIQAREKSGNQYLQEKDLRQDPDVLDTWFSSWLWPISVFDGIRNPNNPEVEYYFPTQDLVTGPDILFFWVARMIMSGYAFRNKHPFSKVYLTGLVRDKQGRKMSKQLGNSPDALGLIEQFGADAVRVGLLLSAPAGNDLLFDEALCQQGKNFANKIWNAYRLLQAWDTHEALESTDADNALLNWYENRFYQTLEAVNDHFDKYRISDAMMAIYKLVWDDYCSWLLEGLKPEYGNPVAAATQQRLIVLFEKNLKLLHPFMPFLSEELWHAVQERSSEEALTVSEWPKAQSFDPKIIQDFEHTQELISNIRKQRQARQIGFKTPLSLYAEVQTDQLPFGEVVQKLGFLSEIIYSVPAEEVNSVSFRVDKSTFFIPLEQSENAEEKQQKLQEEINYLKGFLKGVEKKLSNERFMANAPEKVVALERKKAQDAIEKIALLEKQLQ
ncbi:MAG: valine--tRNA ligase [Flavobacteriaceae bacterium]